jgi:HEPN domain-containing protein
LADGHLDAGIYHCQQAAEKALKGFLVFHEVSFEKIHDLGKIIEQTTKINPAFAHLDTLKLALPKIV